MTLPTTRIDTRQTAATFCESTGHREVRYGRYTITYWPPPIPDRRFDWHYVHDDYDGAPDARDYRCGSAASVEACKAEIDEIEGELDELNAQEEEWRAA